MASSLELEIRVLGEEEASDCQLDEYIAVRTSFSTLPRKLKVP